VTNTPSIEQWQHARIRTVELPSGAGDVDVEPADMAVLLYGDPVEGIEPTVPNELASIAERTEYSGVDAEKMSAEERRTFTRYRHWLIANRLRRPVITEKVARSLPYEDQVAIFRVCLHMDLAERITMASFRGLAGGDTGNGSGKAPKGRAK
jgi:hypothetical protein